MCRKLAISEQTYYRWRREYGGLRVDQAKRFKDLERENQRLKKVVAEGELLSPPRRRRAVQHVCQKLGVPQRRACRILAQPRATQRRMGSVQVLERLSDLFIARGTPDYIRSDNVRPPLIWRS